MPKNEWEYLVPRLENGMRHTPEDLKEMQAWPFERKIQVTQTRIMEWCMQFENKVFVSFSGGKDSTVLLDLARRIDPGMEAAYVDTGLEFPEVRSFALAQKNVTKLTPDMNFREVLDTHGWCYPSKNVAKVVYRARKGSEWASLRLEGLNKDGTPSKYKESHYAKWAFLANSPFKISNGCCIVMKERPFDRYQKQCGKLPIVGSLAAESLQRKQAWLITGCNAFDAKRPMSKPLSFWTEQDILRYLREFQIPYASVYGDIVEDSKGRLRTTGESRTGCIFCPVGAHLGKPNRFQRLAVTHPKLHDYCIHKLGLGELLDYVGVDYRW